MKVRTARTDGKTIIVASAYNGTLLGISYTGRVLWEKELTGFMNHDLWCGDVTGNGSDEILAANADGTLYCIGRGGRLLWKFKPNDAPMYAVCTISHQGTPYVVCGGYDKSIYYLSGEGELIKEVPSSLYSNENPRQPYPKAVPDSGCHLTNFIRPVMVDGSEILAIHGVIHTMAMGARGSLYLFQPLEEQPYSTIKLEWGRPLGELRTADTNGDGNEEILMGTSNMLDASVLLHVDPTNGKQSEFRISTLSEHIDRFGYRVTQPEVITDGDEDKYFILFGSRILLVPFDCSAEQSEVYTCGYSFNDMWNDMQNNKVILASMQSGGSCVHIINADDPLWKEQYQALVPQGKIARILENTAAVRSNLEHFTAPAWERSPRPVYFMSDGRGLPVIRAIDEKYVSPVFLNRGGSSRAENWDRSGLADERYRNRRDQRRTYDATSEEIVSSIAPRYEGAPGLAYWGGHGNDPYMYQLKTNKKILDHANGKKTVLIFPELEDHSHHFAYVMDDYFYPLARYCREKNGMIYVRTKHTFWQANIYLPMWAGLLSGEFSDVFIPAMEETTDKAMELSLASRVGVWVSGATDQWGSRCARDNPSFDRLRQHSHQMLPNHFLRNMIFHISYGAQYLDNFAVDQEYMSLLWLLVAKGALFVPGPSDIISFSPVHMSMLPPDDHYMNRSANAKWTTFFDGEFEENNPFVFSRLSGTWPGAPVTEWDFSRYAAGVKERRQKFLAPYEHGLVLITPPQAGIHADKEAPRGAMVERLNPIYKGIMKEYYTDGRHYYSADGTTTYPADEYYREVEEEIRHSASQLPVTVSGDAVAWVAAQSAPDHIRLTILDGGYINPDDRTAHVSFHSIKPVTMTDILNGESFDCTGSTIIVDIPCGMFRFLDIELEEPLN